jgi:SAM-dependent methyltransferase
MGEMSSTPQFRADLYRGTAADYDRYRVPYLPAMVEDLAARAALSGRGRLLDLACGPGRATFALCRHFREVVAIDQEASSVEYATSVARERGGSHITWLVGRAEDVEIAGSFELVTVGDAFHRLDRPRVAALANQWLEPGGHLALLWTSLPWQGPAAWQTVAMETIRHWMDVTGSLHNIPADLEQSLKNDPHAAVLARTGFDVVGSYEFRVPRAWSVETLVGFAHSTSIFSRAALGDHAGRFEEDLAARLLALHPDDKFVEEIGFFYDLAKKRP